MNPEDLVIEGPLEPKWTHEFTGLGDNWHITNCSMLPFGDKLLLAYRVGWSGSKVFIGQVHEGMRVDSPKEVVVKHELATGGLEDPRLFVHDGKLHLSVTGVRVTRGYDTLGRQLVIRLNSAMEVEEVWEPKYLWTTQWEKNWQVFGNGGGLYAIYSIKPWRVVHLIQGKAEPILEVESGVPWHFGRARGGSPPYRVGNEYYCFFHGTDHSERKRGGISIYTMGVLTFEAKFPFRPLRATKEPIMWPITSDLAYNEELKDKHYVACVFPCGAYHEAGEWIVSYGHNDKACRISAFDAKEIEERLCPI
jgi:hypothetical protein